MNTEESTPLTAGPEDTSADAAVIDTDTAASAAPDDAAPEPEGQPDKAEENGAPKSDSEKLLAGKYKTVDELEKGYKEAEKLVREAAEYRKKVEAYEAAEAKAREMREAEARSYGYRDAESQQIENDVAAAEFNLYVQALETRLEGEDYTKAAQLLQAYRQTGRRDYLEAAKKCVAPEVISQIAVTTARYAGERQNEYAQAKFVEQRQAVNSLVREFCEKNTDWIDANEERQQLVGETIKALGADADLDALKSFIEAIERRAVEDFKKDMEKQKETDAQLSRIPSPSNDGSGKRREVDIEHWQDVDDPAKMRELLRRV